MIFPRAFLVQVSKGRQFPLAQVEAAHAFVVVQGAIALVRFAKGTKALCSMAVQEESEVST